MTWLVPRLPQRNTTPPAQSGAAVVRLLLAAFRFPFHCNHFFRLSAPPRWLEEGWRTIELATKIALNLGCDLAGPQIQLAIGNWPRDTRHWPAVTDKFIDKTPKTQPVKTLALALALGFMQFDGRARNTLVESVGGIQSAPAPAPPQSQSSKTRLERTGPPPTSFNNFTFLT